MVTLREIADAAGVAVSTASRALHRDGRVSAATEARVRRIAEELGYTVNPAARALTTGRTGLVGVLVPHLTNPFFAAVVEGVQEELEGRGGNVVLVEGRGDPQRESRVIRELANHVDAFVLVTPASPEAELEALLEDRIAVTVDRPLPNRSGVVIDTEAGIIELLRELAHRDARRIAYIGGPPNSHRDAQRFAAFERGSAELGVEAVHLGSVVPSVEAGVRIAPLVRGSGIDAAIAFSSHVALGLHFTLGEDSGIEVTAADDLSVANAGAPLLTALKLPLARAGRLAVSLLEADGVSHEHCTAEIVHRAR